MVSLACFPVTFSLGRGLSSFLPNANGEGSQGQTGRQTGRRSAPDQVCGLRTNPRSQRCSHWIGQPDASRPSENNGNPDCFFDHQVFQHSRSAVFRPPGPMEAPLRRFGLGFRYFLSSIFFRGRLALNIGLRCAFHIA